MGVQELGQGQPQERFLAQVLQPAQGQVPALPRTLHPPQQLSRTLHLLLLP